MLHSFFRQSHLRHRPTAWTVNVYICTPGTPRLVTPPRPSPCLDFGFKKLLYTVLIIRLWEYLAQIGRGWRPCNLGPVCCKKQQKSPNQLAWIKVCTDTPRLNIITALQYISRHVLHNLMGWRYFLCISLFTQSALKKLYYCNWLIFHIKFLLIFHDIVVMMLHTKCETKVFWKSR